LVLVKPKPIFIPTTITNRVLRATCNSFQKGITFSI
jgi:hypothetical protein